MAITLESSMEPPPQGVHLTSTAPARLFPSGPALGLPNATGWPLHKTLTQEIREIWA